MDFDELNALASNFDEYPSPEDILHPLQQSDDTPLLIVDGDIAAHDGQISPEATAFRKLVHVPEASSNGYVYSIPDNPIQLPGEQAQSAINIRADLPASDHTNV